MNLSNVVDLQREYFFSGQTKTKDFRIENLKKLNNILENYEDDILRALNKDLSKSNFEAYASELTMAYDEIDLAIKNLGKWMKAIKEKTSATSMPAKS